MKAVRIGLLGVLCAAGLASAAEQNGLNVLYSGRFFGYFRYPDIQRRSAEGCPSDGQNLSAAAAEYLKHVGARPPGQIRVAMGDNFAPEFLSRTLYDSQRFKARDLFSPREDPARPAHWIWTEDNPKKNEASPLGGSVPSDNVGCFLKKAEFQAIVPGKDDFYFGPERVAQLANFLRRRTGELEPVQMLGANLTVVTASVNGSKPLPIEKLDERIQRVFRPKEGVKLSIPKEVLPWLHQIDLLEEKPTAQPSGFLCEPQDGDPNKFELPPYGATARGCQGPITPTAGTEPLSWRFALPSKQPQSPFFLKPGSNYVFCVLHPGADQSKDSCQAFTTRRPLLEAPEAADSGRSLPYFVDVKESVAVFGVVDEEMLNQIGLLNYSWLNVKSDLATTLKIIPAAEALEQVMQLCDDDSACKNARHRILLAQMPTAKAQDLARDLDRKKIHFDLVITQADRENFTGTTSLSKLEKTAASKVASLSPFIVVPDSQYDPDFHGDNFTVRVQQAHLQRKDAWSYLQNDVEEYPLVVPPKDLPDNIKAFEKKINDGAKVKGDFRAEILSLTKERMQSFCHSDLAIVQPRDIFAKYRTVVQF